MYDLSKWERLCCCCFFYVLFVRKTDKLFFCLLLTKIIKVLGLKRMLVVLLRTQFWVKLLRVWVKQFLRVLNILFLLLLFLIIDVCFLENYFWGFRFSTKYNPRICMCALAFWPSTSREHQLWSHFWTVHVDVTEFSWAHTVSFRMQLRRTCLLVTDALNILLKKNFEENTVWLYSYSRDLVKLQEVQVQDISQWRIIQCDFYTCYYYFTIKC